MDKSDLHDYQNKALTFAHDVGRGAMFLEMGLGKTVIALTLIDDLMDAGLVQSALVVAPKKLINMTWKPEIEKWDHLWLQDMTLIEGQYVNRRKQVGNGKGLFATSIDSVANYHELYEVPWDIVIIDESIKIKNSASRRYRGCKHLTKNPKTRVLIMSGIPAPNSEMDLWAQYFILDRGKRLERGIGSYRTKYFEMNPYTNTYTIRGGCGKTIVDKVNDISLAFTAEEYLSMPDKIVTDWKIELSEDVKRKYKKLEKDFILELSQDNLEIFNASALLQKTMQVCNGFVYREDETVRLHDAKLDALEEIVEDDAGENFIVAYKYKEDLRALQERFPYAKTVDPENVIAWNQGKVRMLLVHPQSAGYGLNLQDGGSVIVWFSLTWSYSDYEQTIARIYRQGQKKPVRVVRLICDDTVEGSIAKALERKREGNKTVMESLREILIDNS